MSKGVFIVLEGVDGSGKTTAIAGLEKILQTNNISYHITKEPGGCDLADSVRDLVLSNNGRAVTAMTELLLIFAGRNEHIQTTILPLLAQGIWVISDRFVDSSYAYQGGGRGIDAAWIAKLDEWVCGDCQPDLIFFFDIDATAARRRRSARDLFNRIDKEGHMFFENIITAYRNRFDTMDTVVRRIDAHQTRKNVNIQVAGQLQNFIQRWRTQ